MKFGALILILSTPAAWAGFGNVVPDSSIPHRPCGQTTFERSADYLHKAGLMAVKDDEGNIIKDKDGLYKDTRGNLYDLAPKLSGDLKLNSAEIQDVNNASPMIECKGDAKVAAGSVKKTTASYEQRDGSGFLYGNGEQYATAAHNLFDSEGKLYKSCVLRAHANSEMKDKVPLDLSMIEILNDPNGRAGSAIAVVKLKSKLYKPNGTPIEGLTLNPTGKAVDFGKKVAMVSSIQYKGDRTQADVRNDKEMLGGPGKQQIIQETRRPDDPVARQKSQSFYGESSTTYGVSGGYGYSRGANGKIVVEVVFTGGGAGKRDGTPFSMEGQFSYGYILDKSSVDRMMEFQSRRQLQGMEANARSKQY